MAPKKTKPGRWGARPGTGAVAGALLAVATAILIHQRQAVRMALGVVATCARGGPKASNNFAVVSCQQQMAALWWRAADRTDALQGGSQHSGVKHGPAFGIFPKGCKWRTVSEMGPPEEDPAASYEFWDADTATWASGMPLACSPTGFDASSMPPGWKWHNSTPRSEVNCDAHACYYENLLHNNGRWYILVDGGAKVPVMKVSRNQEVLPLHFKDAWAFLDGVKWRVVPGHTILLDFIYFTHPTAIGHWWEMLGPMYSTLKRVPAKAPCDQFVLLHLQRRHLLEWVRAMIGVALGVSEHGALPPILMQLPATDLYSQLSSPIEGYDPGTWYIFEHVTLTKDLHTGGGRKFATTADAREFRAQVYQQYGLPPPQQRAEVPRLITFQRKRANRRILNEEEVMALLREYGTLEVVEYGSSSSLRDQLVQMQRTGVYVSVHTSNMANTPLLQPGSAVIELIQRHWHVNGMDTSFYEQTGMMADIHHFAWRAQFRNQTVYLNPRDEAKVGHWLASECRTRECVEAHTRVDVRIDVKELRALLDERLPCVWAGRPVPECAMPWPKARDVVDDTYVA